MAHYAELTPADLQHRWRGRTVLESVDEAVVVAGQTEEYLTPEAALRWLLQLAWDDLESGRGRASKGRWSVDCDHQVTRIVGLTRLVGPLSWETVPFDLILDGVYERIHESIGVPTPLSDVDRERARAGKARRDGAYLDRRGL